MDLHNADYGVYKVRLMCYNQIDVKKKMEWRMTFNAVLQRVF